MTADEPKSIDTYYNGYKFRSRLEARWAVFFDELHIPYKYEPKGFDLNGTWYLPDFHLINGLILHKFQPTQLDQIWVEIKPVPDLSEQERQKIAEFVKQTDYHILLIAGDPDINVILKFIDHHPETGWFVTDVRWLELPDGSVGLVPIENLNNIDLLSQTNTPRLRNALDKARQSRFEFGQTPLVLQEVVEEKNKKPIETRLKSKTKICRSCGKEYKPYRQHFIYCASCYQKQKKADLVNIREPVNDQGSNQISINKKTNSKTLSRIPSYVVRLLILGGFIAIFFWFANYMFKEGLFSSSLLPTPSVTIPATYTPAPTATIIATPTSIVTATPIVSTCTCVSNTYNCSDFSTQVEAQACYDRCFPSAGDIHFLDSNEDGKVCVTLP